MYSTETVLNLAKIREVNSTATDFFCPKSCGERIKTGLHTVTERRATNN